MLNQTEPVIKYTYNAAGDYSFPFRVFDEEDLLLQITDANGIINNLTLATDYTVTLSTTEDGGVCHVSQTDHLGTLSIKREVPFTQETDWVNNSRFNVDLLEQDFDKVIMLLQQMKVYVDEGSIATNWVGNWTPNTSYSGHDIVTAPNGNWYNAAMNHKSGTSFDDDLAAGRWVMCLDYSEIKSDRERAEQAREDSEDARDIAISAKDDAETYKNQASGFRDEASIFRDDAEDFKDDAETAANSAAAYKDRFHNYGDVSGSVTLDCDSYRSFAINLTGDTQITFQRNSAATNDVYNIDLFISRSGAHQISFAETVRWDYDFAPSMSTTVTNTTYLYTFKIIHNQNIFGFFCSEDM